MYNGVCQSCDNCNTPKSWNYEGSKTNMSINGSCGWTDEFSCDSYVNFKNKKMPSFGEDNIERINLNQYFGLPYSRQFFEYEKGTCGNEKQYFSPYDSRLVNPMHNMKTMLDKPPYDSNIPIEEIYTEKVYQKPKYYKDYSDINSGQIQYYYDKNNLEPYNTPNYVLNSNVNYNIFKDPMDSIKTEYIRNPTLFSNKMISKDRSTQDILTFREDMFERLSRINNQKDYSMRYYS